MPNASLRTRPDDFSAGELRIRARARRVTSDDGFARFPWLLDEVVYYTIDDGSRMFITSSAMAGEQPIIESVGSDFGISICDGRAYFASTREGNGDIFSANLDGTDVRRLTSAVGSRGRECARAPAVSESQDLPCACEESPTSPAVSSVRGTSGSLGDAPPVASALRGRGPPPPPPLPSSDWPMPSILTDPASAPWGGSDRARPTAPTQISSSEVAHGPERPRRSSRDATPLASGSRLAKLPCSEKSTGVPIALARWEAPKSQARGVATALAVALVFVAAAVPPRRARAVPPNTWTFPIRLHVPSSLAGARTQRWLDASVAIASSALGQAGVHFIVSSRASLPDTVARVASDAELRALEALASPGVINVFVVRELRIAHGRPRPRSVCGTTEASHRRAWSTYVVLLVRCHDEGLAHELGHYFGLPHSSVRGDLMWPEAGRGRRSPPPIVLSPAERDRVIRSAAQYAAAGDPAPL